MQARILPAVCLLLLLPAAAQAQTPRLSDERIVAHTDGGDIVFALYPDVAPRHTEQILNLVGLGCYDHTYFDRVEPGFVLQLAELQYHRHTSFPLTEAQAKAVHPLPAEFSQLKHRRGTLSMARMDGQPNSATTSFSILLGDAPHLDGQYTVFGEVVHGMDVVDRLVQVPPLFIDPLSPPRPMIPLDVEKMEIVPADKLDLANLTPARDVPIPADKIPQAHTLAWAAHRKALQEGAQRQAFFSEVDKTYLLSGGLLLVLLVSLVSVFGAGRITMRWLISLNMLTILIAAFLALVVLSPYVRGQENTILAGLLFISFFGVFKLLSRFESVG